MEDRKLVVAGVDGSEDGLRAVKYGASFVAEIGGELLLVHAVGDVMLAGAWGMVYDPEVPQNAEVSVNEAAITRAREIGLPGEHIRTEVVLGLPGGVLGGLSEVAGLIVMGRRSVSELERMFVGSTGVSVVASPRCPALVISAAAHPQDVGNKKLIGVRLSTSRANHPTLATAFEQAQLFGARLEIVHALQPPIGLFGPKLGPADPEELVRFTRDGIEAMASEQIKTFPGAPYGVVVVVATPTNEFITRSENYDLLVLDAGEEVIPGFGLGGLLCGLTAHSLCPLYIIHGK